MTHETALVVQNGLASDDRQEVAAQLGGVLDAVYSLMVRTQVCHRNLEGLLFEPMHKLTEAQYTSQSAEVDDIAERIQAPDAKASGGGNVLPTGVSNLSQSQSAASMIADLVRTQESVVRTMRPVVTAATKADEVVTADLLTGFIAQDEKDAWMLQSMLRGS